MGVRDSLPDRLITGAEGKSVIYQGISNLIHRCQFGGASAGKIIGAFGHYIREKIALISIP